MLHQDCLLLRMVKIDWESTDPSIRELLSREAQSFEFKRDQLIVEAGKMCNHLYLIESGMTRNFYYDPKGNDITHWFSGQGALVTSPPSFFKREPSPFRIEAIVDTQARALTHDQLERAYQTIPQLERFVKEVVIETMITLGRKIIDLQTKSAEERYNDLLETHPNIFQKAKLGHIAGYLGITQQSLSRIRAGKS